MSFEITHASNAYSKGQSFNNWSIDVSKNIGLNNEPKDFIVSDKKDTNEFLGDFVDLTRSYIKEYDTDGDGVISFDEFKAKETQIAKDNYANEPDEETLKLAFDRLNVEKDDEYGDKLSEKEVFSYFMGLDRLQNGDGKITKEEYSMMSLSLADKSDKDNAPGKMVTEYLKDIYSQLFKK